MHFLRAVYIHIGSLLPKQATTIQINWNVIEVSFPSPPACVPPTSYPATGFYMERHGKFGLRLK